MKACWCSTTASDARARPRRTRRRKALRALARASCSLMGTARSASVSESVSNSGAGHHPMMCWSGLKSRRAGQAPSLGLIRCWGPLVLSPPSPPHPTPPTSNLHSCGLVFWERRPFGIFARHALPAGDRDGATRRGHAFSDLPRRPAVGVGRRAGGWRVLPASVRQGRLRTCDTRSRAAAQ